MSETTIPMSADPRTDFGKGAARRLRRSGKVPAVVYGSGTAPVHIALDGHDLAQALKRPRVVLAITVDGTEHVCAPRDVQQDVVRQVLEHVDLVVLDRAEVQARAAAAEAIARAEAAAEEAGVDVSDAVAAIEEAIAAGTDPAQAADAAIARAVADQRAYEAAQDVAAEAAEAAEPGEGEDAGFAAAGPAEQD